MDSSDSRRLCIAETAAHTAAVMSSSTPSPPMPPIRSVCGPASSAIRRSAAGIASSSGQSGRGTRPILWFRVLGPDGRITRSPSTLPICTCLDGSTGSMGRADWGCADSVCAGSGRRSFCMHRLGICRLACRFVCRFMYRQGLRRHISDVGDIQNRHLAGCVVIHFVSFPSALCSRFRICRVPTAACCRTRIAR